MSILIRGMEMPTRCGLCPMFCDDFNDYCSAAQRSIPFDAEKPEWCPLFPLPAGHGRLIDADEFIERVRMDDRTTIIEEMHVAEILSEAPTIVPAEGGTDE